MSSPNQYYQWESFNPEGITLFMDINDCHNESVPTFRQSAHTLCSSDSQDPWVLNELSDNNEPFIYETSTPNSRATQFLVDTIPELDNSRYSGFNCGMESSYGRPGDSALVGRFTPGSATDTTLPTKDLNVFGTLPETQGQDCYSADASIHIMADRTQEVRPCQLMEHAEYCQPNLDAGDNSEGVSIYPLGYSSAESMQNLSNGISTLHDGFSGMDGETFDRYDDFADQLSEPTLGRAQQGLVRMVPSSSNYQKYHSSMASLAPDRGAVRQVKTTREEVWDFSEGLVEKTTLTFFSIYAPTILWPAAHPTIHNYSAPH
ncbi:uncharacterized protein DFL_000091 [Arthrobotrys flagrans]|uniref:Uncharacterized protein n=1 Tax=Arthrobotrys flagrans TaxID=97331 RepID=A0A437ACS5_ARTFL|nr:hypothetical protein DFL_000091 [Arthrobotrys flagrans]